MFPSVGASRSDVLRGETMGKSFCCSQFCLDEVSWTNEFVRGRALGRWYLESQDSVEGLRYVREDRVGDATLTPLVIIVSRLG